MVIFQIVGTLNMTILIAMVLLIIVTQLKPVIMHQHHSILYWSYHNGKKNIIFNSINYFALRNLTKSYDSTRINTLAIYGLIISLIILPVIVYVPGIQSVF